MGPNEGLAAHSEITLQLAQKEHEEHMEGMDEAAQEMSRRPLIIKAYALDDANAPSGSNVKTVHFVRHGQGFHNLMADLYKEAGRNWVQVRNLFVMYISCEWFIWVRNWERF